MHDTKPTLATSDSRLGSACPPSVEESFSVLAGFSQPPQDRDTISYRRLCRAVLEDAIDQAGIRLTGKPLLWPNPHPGNTMTARLAPQGSQDSSGEVPLESNKLQSAISDLA